MTWDRAQVVCYNKPHGSVINGLGYAFSFTCWVLTPPNKFKNSDFKCERKGKANVHLGSEDASHSKIAGKLLKSLYSETQPSQNVAFAFPAPEESKPITQLWNDLYCQLLKYLHRKTRKQGVSHKQSILSSITLHYPHRVFRYGACQMFPREHDIYRPATLELYSFLKSLFHTISEICNVQLTRYDLHHGHLFYNIQLEKLGILFHHTEYPAYCKQFPHELGYCQNGSHVRWNETRRTQRNVLWMQGAPWMVVVDCSSHSEAARLMVSGKKCVGTLDENEFGDMVLADVFYFPSSINRGVHLVPFV